MGFTVYKHVNKINGKIYIGITGQNPKKRWAKGLGYKGMYFYNAIEKYGWDNFEHIIIAEDLSENAATQMEKDLIARYDCRNRSKGYNIEEGGRKPPKNCGNYGNKNAKSSAVNVFDSDHNFIARYESQNLAAKALGITRNGITKNCEGIGTTYKGYIFEYADKMFKKPFKYAPGKHPNHRKVKVNLLDDQGNIIESFDSYLDAATKYNCRANGIAKCCNGYLSTYLGRRWSRAVY